MTETANSPSPLTSAFSRTISILVLCTLLAAGCSEPSEEPAPSPPNVVFILIDDLGWADTGVYGSTFYETPNIDALAASGMRFTDFYTDNPVCSPTRAAILSGKNPARLNLTNWIGGEQNGKLLPAEYIRELPLAEVTLAEAFKEAGYQTGFIGKWHLGDSLHFPQYQGFDVNIGGHSAGQPGSFFFPYKNPRSTYFDVPHLSDGVDGEYLTDRLTDEAIAFIDTNKEQPFLLYFAYYAVHTPLESKPELTAHYEQKVAALPNLEGPSVLHERETVVTRRRQDHPVYGGMIHSTDENIGRIIQSLDSLGLSDNTLVVFTSDNGGLSTLSNNRDWAPTSNAPLRAGKGWLYEGGIRAPLIVRWPGVIEADQVSPLLTSTVDLYPTLLEMAELPQRPTQHMDGTSLASVLRGTGAFERSTLQWHFPHYHGSGNTPSGAIRDGDYKLIEWFEDGHTELYNLAEDLGEQHNLADDMPEKVAELRQTLQSWRTTMDARMPSPNPDFE